MTVSSDLIHQLEVERAIANSTRHQKVQTAAHQKMTGLAQHLVDTGQAATLRDALLKIPQRSFDACYAMAYAEDAQAQLAAMTGQSEQSPSPV